MDKLIHVDVYLSGCPPEPKVVIDAITKLRKKIYREIYEDQFSYQQENMCFTINHKFYVGREEDMPHRVVRYFRPVIREREAQFTSRNIWHCFCIIGTCGIKSRRSKKE
ncbi:hypothetical protein RYX36_028653, partial [Vicia faba]